ncbi:DUF2399 domain-containing protein [Streptomyces sp. SR27]|uniref:DUF2399 domain-containing protein n=1 Tax=Streptomyces sp. SR27 TaxID=3076630 RepID=UPI00295C2EC2|nr:DUF2399 domain-containing protein [Streptomyces sp. SR27]
MGQHCSTTETSTGAGSASHPHCCVAFPGGSGRYTAAHYRAAALARPDGPPLAAQPAEALWDPDLQQALLELAVRVEEETVLDVLLSDLA